MSYEIVKETFDDSKSIDVDSEEFSVRCKRILSVIFDGDQRNNVAILGSAGVGKSHTTMELATALTKRNLVVYVTATTGVAALNNGENCTTLHRWAGLGLAEGTAQQLAKVIQHDANKLIKWQGTDVLFIDEVSMLSYDLFEKFEAIARIVRKNDLPFGGILVIPVGDFLQLPPVVGKFCFLSDAWQRCDFNKIELKKAYRFNDEKYHQLIQRARFGVLTEEDHALLITRVEAFINMADKFEEQKKAMHNSGDEMFVLPTVLYSTRKAVELENLLELESLPTEQKIYEATDYAITSLGTRVDGHDAVTHFKKALEDASPEKLALKVGAQVMLTVNQPDGMLVNGSRGVVIALKKTYVKVKFAPDILKNVHTHKWVMKKDKIRVVREQLPLVLAWSLTTHKSQSSTLTSVIADLGESIFLAGQGYTVLSRVRNLESLYLIKYSEKSIRANKDAVKYHLG